MNVFVAMRMGRNRGRSPMRMCRSPAAMLDPLMQPWADADRAGKRERPDEPGGKQLVEDAFHSGKSSGIERSEAARHKTFVTNNLNLTALVSNAAASIFSTVHRLRRPLSRAARKGHRTRRASPYLTRRDGVRLIPRVGPE